MNFGARFRRSAIRASCRLSPLSFCLLIALITFAAPADRAQTPDSADASPLVAVTVAGSAKFSSDQIAAATGLQPGTKVTRTDIQAGADRLARLGPFASVQ